MGKKRTIELRPSSAWKILRKFVAAAADSLRDGGKHLGLARLCGAAGYRGVHLKGGLLVVVAPTSTCPSPHSMRAFVARASTPPKRRTERRSDADRQSLKAHPARSKNSLRSFMGWMSIVAACSACSLTSEDLDPSVAPGNPSTNETTASDVDGNPTSDTNGGSAREVSGIESTELALAPAVPAPPPDAGSTAPASSCAEVDGGCECSRPTPPCTSDDDCSEGICSDGRCVVPSCSDGILNQDETAIDCGGSCERCSLDETCQSDADCESDFCEAGACTERIVLVCGDGRQNGDESDVDCGGTEPVCPRCADGFGCSVAADCDSGSCFDGLCGSCFDGLQNGEEEGVDCGGDDPACPPCIRCTEQTSTDLSVFGDLTTISADGCAMITQFPGYAPTQLQAQDQGPYPVTFSWRQDCSGFSGSATFVAPYQVVQFSGLSTACPVFFEMEGGAGPLDLRWW